MNKISVENTINFKNTNKTLSLEDTATLKTFFTLTVLIHHTYQNTSFLKGGAEVLFEALGFLSVSIFLFLSGYGLTSIYKIKGDNYVNRLPKHKILPLYIKSLFLILIYFVLWNIVSNPLSLKRIILSFFFGHTVIKYGWYIQTTLFLYLLFYLAFRPKNKYLKVITLIVGYALYFALCRFLDCWSMWYISVLAFGAGIFYALYPTKINTPICLIAFAIAFTLGNFRIFSYEISDIFKTICSVTFPFIIIKLKMAIPKNPEFLQKLSTYTFEIYASQGIFFTLYHSSIIYIKSDLLYTLLCLASTLLFAILLNKLFTKIK